MSIPQGQSKEGQRLLENRSELVESLEKGNKPAEAWRIGTEHEKFGYNRKTLQPLPYDDDNGPCSVKGMLTGLRDQFGWQDVREGDTLIGLQKGAANVSLEPGGQLELSGAPLKTVHQTCAEANTHLREVKHVADEIGAGFIGLGTSPDWTLEQIPVMPKGRYGIMRRYMPKVGTRGLDMMFRSCTIQVNLDFSSEVDMVKKFRVGLALQPVATVLFANSPFINGKPTGSLSERSIIWQDVDKQRTGMLPFIFKNGFGFEQYVDYALDVPMYFVYRQGKYIDCAGMSFRDFLKGQLPALPGEKPTRADWEDHLTTIFPEVRIKHFMEMRGADGGQWRRICALPAFWVGLMYDNVALDAAWEVVKNWTDEEREQLRHDAPRLGLDAVIRGQELHDIARTCLSISRAGLVARAQQADFENNESHFLNDLQHVVDTGKTAAQEILEKFNREWQQKFEPLYREYSY